MTKYIARIDFDGCPDNRRCIVCPCYSDADGCYLQLTFEKEFHLPECLTTCPLEVVE